MKERYIKLTISELCEFLTIACIKKHDGYEDCIFIDLKENEIKQFKKGTKYQYIYKIFEKRYYSF